MKLQSKVTEKLNQIYDIKKPLYKMRNMYVRLVDIKEIHRKKEASGNSVAQETSSVSNIMMNDRKQLL